jgi:hypothetical protein
MNKSYFRSREGSVKRKARRIFKRNTQCFRRPEELFLQPISIHATLSEILNRICSALDCQVGNVVSHIFLRGGDASEFATIATQAARFGLHTFCSEGVVGENDEPLGSLEMYSYVKRNSSTSEFQLIERAKYLAAIAIRLENEASHRAESDMSGNRPVRGSVLEWPVF